MYRKFVALCGQYVFNVYTVLPYIRIYFWTGACAAHYFFVLTYSGDGFIDIVAADITGCGRDCVVQINNTIAIIYITNTCKLER